MSVIPFSEVPTQQKIPSSSKIIELLGKSDIVKNRYTVSTQPYSGQNAGIGSGLNSKIIFKLFNNADYADLQTAYITFQSTFAVTGTANLNHLNFEDNVLSWFITARTLVNDQVVEEISNFNQFVNMITYATMSKSNYETSGSFMGCYRHSNYLLGGARGLVIVNAIAGGLTGAVTSLDFGSQLNGQQLWEQLGVNGVPSWVPTATTTTAPTGGSGANDSWANSRVKNATYWSCPLAGYLGLFSLDKFFPLRSIASITLELTLPTNIQGVLYDNLLPAYNGTINVAGSTLALSDLYIHYDCVRMSDAYYELMDQELVDPNGMGAQFTVNTVESVPSTIPVGSGKKVLIASKGTRYLKSFWCVQSPAYAFQSGFMPPSSVFVPAGFQSAQLVVNSKRFPELPIDNRPRAYEELMKSVNKYHSVIGDSVINYPKFLQDLDGNTNNDISAKPDLEYSNFMLGFNLEQVLDAPEVSLQGLDTMTAGFQIQLELTSTVTTPVTAYLFPHFSKVLRVKGGSIAILN